MLPYSVAITVLLFSNSLLNFHPLNAKQDADSVIVNGIASSDVTNHSAIIWSLANKQAQIHNEFDMDSNFSNPISKIAFADQETDFSAHTKLEDLRPDSVYYYRVWFSALTTGGKSIISERMIGTFQTSPASDSRTDQPLNFVFGGDLGSENFCRRIGLGYSIFSVIKSLSPDFFVFNGDQIYADDHPCNRGGPVPGSGVVGWENIEGNLPNVIKANWTSLADLHNFYLERWEYNRNDVHLQNLLQDTYIYSQPDDHEVVNNYGGKWSYFPGKLENKSGYPNLVRVGMNLFFSFSPIDRNKDEQNRIYRSFNWGKD
jgi:alkaline phosphatase D